MFLALTLDATCYSVLDTVLLLISLNYELLLNAFRYMPEVNEGPEVDWAGNPGGVLEILGEWAKEISPEAQGN